MLSFVHGDILESQAHTLVNTVNCRGVMGKGVALAFKRRYPMMFKDYVRRCKAREVKPGHPYVYATAGRQIINFPTKDDWRRPSRLDYIKTGLESLRKSLDIWHVRSLAVPALGCGNGGLDWHDVKPLIVEYLGDLDIRVEVFEPSATASHQHIPSDSRLGTDIPLPSYTVISNRDLNGVAVQASSAGRISESPRNQHADGSVAESENALSTTFAVAGAISVSQAADVRRCDIDQPALFTVRPDDAMVSNAHKVSANIQASMVCGLASVADIRPISGSGRNVHGEVTLDDGTLLIVKRADAPFIEDLRCGDVIQVCFVPNSSNLLPRLGSMRGLALRIRDGRAIQTTGLPGRNARPMTARST